MADYFLRRILIMVPTFLGITLVTFVVINMAPGGPIERMLADIRFGAAMSGTGEAGLGGITHEGVTEDIIEELRRQFGFHKPLLERYGIWLRPPVAPAGSGCSRGSPTRSACES